MKRDRSGPSTPARWDSLPGIGLGLVVASVAATPLIPSDATSSRNGAGLFLIMLQLILLVGCCFLLIRHGEFRLRFCRTDGAILLFVGWQAAATWATLNQGNARQSLNVLWQYVASGAVYWMLRQWCLSPRQQKALVVVMLAVALTLCGMAFEQYFFSLPRDRAAFERDPEGVLARAGIEAPAGSPQWQLFKNRIESKEPFATFALTNSLAGLLAPWLVASLAAAWFDGRAAAKPWRTMATFGLIGLVIAACLLLTKSRSAILGAAAGVALMGLYGLRQRWRHVLWAGAALTVGGAGLFAAAWSVGAVDRELFTEATKSLGYRWEYWQATAAMIREHPWFGVGLGNFQECYAGYKLPQSSEMILDPHNFLLELAATGGVPSLVLAFAIGVAAATRWRRGAPQAAGPQLAGQQPARPRLSGPQQEALRRLDVGPVWIGGSAAGILAFVVGYEAPLGLEWAGLLALLVICLVGWLLRPWIEATETPRFLPLLVLSVELINLLAAGALSFAGVAISLWVALALLVNQTAVGQTDRRPRPAVGWGLLAASLLSLGLFWLTAYGPRIAGEVAAARLGLAMQLGQPEEARNQARKWIADDPWSPDARYQLAAVYFRIWQETGDHAAFQTFARELRSALDRDPNSHLRQRLSGDLYLRAWRMSNDPEHLHSAIQHYEAAVRLYPNGAANHAQLAWALHLAGQRPKARDAAEKSLVLDRLNPHLDQKLARQTIFDTPPAESLRGKMPRYVTGDDPEQRMAALRTGQYDGEVAPQ